MFYRPDEVHPASLSLSLSFLPSLGREKNPINIKKFGGTPPLLDCNQPVFRGNVAFVPRTFCPVYVEMHTQIRSGRPGCPGTRPQSALGTLPRHTDRQIPVLGENQKVTAGRGQQTKKRHEKFATNVSTIYDTLRHFMTISVSLLYIGIKNHKT